jgi:acetyl esterase
MAINKAMKMALKAISYPDMKNVYKMQRAIQNVKSPILKPLYDRLDPIISCNGREVPVRLYTPLRIESPLLMLFFHGGGWVTESVDTYDSVCRCLARQMRCRVISVEYGLAPENPFPNGLEDCYAVAKELFMRPECFDVHPENIVLIGDSAGGNLAAAVSLMVRDQGEFQVHTQILLYPATHNDHSNSSKFPSIVTNGKDYLLTSKRVREYMELYAGKREDFQNPYFAPLLAKDFSHQPRTLIITAEYDPLRDEGEAYGEALRSAGNTVAIYRMKDALHGFFSLDYHFVHVKRAYQVMKDFLDWEVKHDLESRTGMD